jgi:predicted RNase H-like HicB family nuclease
MKSGGFIILTLKFAKEGKRWTAYCIQLGTATYGRSIQEATERIQEAVSLHLNTLEDVGECERFLKEHGITFYPSRPKHVDINLNSSQDSHAYFQSYVSPVCSELRA